MALSETQLTAWAGSSTSTRTNTITSGSFTPAAGSLVVVVTGCGNEAGVTVTGITVSDSVSGTWTQLAHLTAGGQFADASVWVKDAGASPSAQTVTVTMAPSGVLDVGLSVRQFTGAAAAASQTGVHNTASGTIATVSITPGTTGSQVVGAWGNADNANVTANGSTTIYGQTSDTSGAQEGGLKATSLSTSGTPVTLGYTVAQGGSGFAVAEILPASGTTHSGSATFSGTGSLTATGTVVLPGTATLSGTGSLTAAGHTTRTRAVTLSGTGTLTAAGSLFVPAGQAFNASPGSMVPGLASPGLPALAFIPVIHTGPLRIVMPGKVKTVTAALALALPKPAVTVAGVAGSIGPLHIPLPLPRLPLSGKTAHNPLHITLPASRVTLNTGKVIHQPLNITVPKPSASLNGKRVHAGALALHLS